MAGDSPRKASSKRQLRSREDHLPRLLKYLPDDPDTAELLEAARCFLQMPSSFSGLFRIVENLEQLLPMVSEQVPEVEAECARVARWCQLIAEIPPSAPIRQEDMFAGAYVRKDAGGQQVVNPPLTGLYTDHPVWCVLWFTSGSAGDVRRADAYRRLQAYYLGAWMRLQKESRWLRVPRRIVEAGRLLRRLHQPEHGNVLDLLLPDAICPELLYQQLVNLHENGDLAHYCGAFAEMLNEALLLNHPPVFRVRASGARRRHTRGYSRDDPNRLYSNHAAYWRFVEPGAVAEDWDEVAVEEQQPDPLVAGFLDEQGIASSEFDDPDIAWVGISQKDSPLERLPPVGALFAVARARARHLAMDAQRFTTRRTRIRLGTLLGVMGVLDRLYHGATRAMAPVRPGAPPSETSRRIHETVRLMAISLVTGTAPENVVGLRLARQPTELPEDFQLAWVETSSWKAWIRPYASPHRKELEPGSAGKTLTPLPRVILSDIWGVAQHLGEPTGQTWFSRPVQEYREAFEVWIAPELQQAGVDACWRRFEVFGDIVPSWFYGQEEGDHLRVAALFGRDDRLAHTHRYYTALDRQKLDHFYVSGMQALWNSLKSNGFRSESGLFRLGKRVIFPHSVVGDDRVPRLACIRELSEVLHTRLGAKPAASGVADWVKWHNEATAYLALGLAITTGFRAVRTPLPDLTAIDVFTGFLCLQEKDREDGSHARIVWLPELLREQVLRYLRHLGRLWRRLPEGFPIELPVPATKYRDRSQFDAASYHLDLTRTLFFIEQDESGTCRPVELTGQALQRQLEAVQPGSWPVPNAGRHLLRTFLTQAECPATLINTHLGHWAYGEEPWGPYSAFDPWRYRETIALYLTRLLKRVDYRLMELP